jgi:asparagine synthase (glutamine-hydrolysing)
MCGILVTYGLDRPFSHALLRTLRKRGPDEIGFWTEQGLGMAHARLAIIGLDERGVEPMENDTHVLVYNGEIYNFDDIKRRLQTEGVPVTGVNDAEVLLQAWSHWGAAILPELTGFWAFAIYDKVKRTLTVVRDQLGIKPLYCWHSGNRLCVSSLISTILQATGESPALDYAALSEYVAYQFTFGDKTFFQTIKKVLPGTLIEFDLASGTMTTSCYEDIFAPSQQVRRPATAEWVEETRELLTQCVLDSTISDTSFTTFCSGGIDSSLITRLANPEIAYHCNYTDPDCNETFYAQQVVSDTDTRLFVVNAQDSFNLVTALNDIVADYDELTIGSVILPLDDLLAQVKRRYKVILTGTGGDELFAGYVRYQLALGECYQDSYRALYYRTQQLESVADRFELTHRKGDAGWYRFYDPAVQASFRDAFANCQQGGSDLEAMLRFDRTYFLRGLLNIDDKMCGRHSLESRPSFLHQKFVRHMQAVDAQTLLSNGDLKATLRQIATGRLPKSVVYRTDKMGFTTPIGTFVNHSAHVIREQIANSRFRELYDLRNIHFTADTKWSREVFGLLMLDLWLNHYATSPA